MNMNTDIDLKPAQWTVFCSPRRFRVLAAGRRFGKILPALSIDPKSANKKRHERRAFPLCGQSPRQPGRQDLNSERLFYSN